MKHRSSFEFKAGSNWYKSVNLTEKSRFCFSWQVNSQVSECCSKKEGYRRSYEFFREIPEFFDRESKLKLVHCLNLKQLVFCNAMLYGLLNKDLHCFQMILIAGVKTLWIYLGMYITNRITPTAVNLHFLLVKAGIEYKVWMLAHKSLLLGEPQYLRIFCSRFRFKAFEVQHPLD